MPSFFKRLLKKKTSKKVVNKAEKHAQQHIQTHAADYSDRLGARAENYAGRYEFTREHAPQIRDVSTRGAAVGLGVASQYAADRQTSQYRPSNSSNNIGTATAQGPRRSAWERAPGSRPSQPAYSGGLGLTAPQATGTYRTGGRTQVPSSQDTWYESRNIRIGGGQDNTLVVKKDPVRARRFNR